MRPFIFLNPTDLHLSLADQPHDHDVGVRVVSHPGSRVLVRPNSLSSKNRRKERQIVQKLRWVTGRLRWCEYWNTKEDPIEDRSLFKELTKLLNQRSNKLTAFGWYPVGIFFCNPGFERQSTGFGKTKSFAPFVERLVSGQPAFKRRACHEETTYMTKP